ncbi:hypothetical protein BJ508DRAFT_161996 [Ascobolus immersus RN42]|uniref:Uncharacterized protein n=1 Tax=Ascobolus immersus RN42 TaxID=1160509 RepID=A0A3N4HXN5_ASCIM|nr:hypothetical protein BJ508DRAFT_161996 [Ascobolus immersus RN42]
MPAAERKISTLFPLPVAESRYKHTIRLPRDPNLRERIAEAQPPNPYPYRTCEPTCEPTRSPSPVRSDPGEPDPVINYNHPLTPARTSRKRKRPGSPPRQSAPTERQSHLCVLNTLLHRCLITRDYERARRAFALLIRSKDVDLRLFWKTGLQILRQTAGYDAACLFLELLKIRFPYNKIHHANHVSDEHLALLCEEVRAKVLEEREERRRKFYERKAAHEAKVENGEDDDDEDEPTPPPPETDAEHMALLLNDNQPEETVKQAPKKKRRHQKAPKIIRDSALQFNETLFELQFPSPETMPEYLSGAERDRYKLQRATTMKSQLVETMLSPPFTDSLRLWFLRARVNLLLCELLKDQLEDTSATDRSAWEREWSVPSSMRSEAFDPSHSDQGTAWRTWKKSCEDARCSLEECMARGCNVPEEMWEEVRGMEAWDEGMREEREVGGWIASQPQWSQMGGASQLPGLPEMEGLEYGTQSQSRTQRGWSEELEMERYPDEMPGIDYGDY